VSGFTSREIQKQTRENTRKTNKHKTNKLILDITQNTKKRQIL